MMKSPSWFHVFLLFILSDFTLSPLHFPQKASVFQNMVQETFLVGGGPWTSQKTTRIYSLSKQGHMDCPFSLLPRGYATCGSNRPFSDKRKLYIPYSPLWLVISLYYPLHIPTNNYCNKWHYFRNLNWRYVPYKMHM